MPSGFEPAASGYSVTLPLESAAAILSLEPSVNQTRLSGPKVTAPGEAFEGMAYSMISPTDAAGQCPALAGSACAMRAEPTIIDKATIEFFFISFSVRG
ncbi:hypothetical protein BE20_57000 [Sorangium cellulosum]|nr:hypothetical protein BE20_57000 [Sorangium cellulosum]